ncbi:hypothetical protein FNU79_10335 [Deinococcus detaillensis]|uniref:Uncharacterized protein n=1 Tax=Deinococcus detaillensis TaxID=2592048 RepID=A0A553UWN9_9DEIO|nr:hypothetical protein [Deinococcus detaillensis]TSA84623.1 hypothetical protein FNU79_10335 [Deinococcus detaillensis]
MKPPSLLSRLLIVLGLVALLLFDLLVWQHHRLSDLPLWIWGALGLSLVILVSQWPQHSNFAGLRRVPLGWRGGMTVGLFIFFFYLADHPLPSPHWGFALAAGLFTGLASGYFRNQSASAQAIQRENP